MDRINQYTYRVSWSEDDSEHVATCAEFPSLSWLDASPEKALKGIRKVVSECLADMEQNGEVMPEPFSTRAYSGRFMVRIPPIQHRNLAVQAAESGVSLNRLVSHKLAR